MSNHTRPGMTPEKREIVALLDEVRRGDATPAVATDILRRALRPEASATAHLYAALRDLTWGLVASRGAAPDIPEWYDVVRHAAALSGRRGHGEVAIRLRTLAELLAQTGRFAERQPSDEILRRSHVADLLRCLDGEAWTPRAELADRVGLADANLSRVLKLLLVEGLITRSASGRAAKFQLTPSGAEAARRAGVAASRPAPDPDAWWDDIPVAIAVWDGAGRSVGCNAGFRKLADAKDGDLADFTAWRGRLSEIARDERPLAQDGAWELRIGETRWVHCIEQRTKGGGRVVLGHDISAFKAAERLLEQRLEALTQTDARQRRDIASLEAKLVEAERRQHAYRYSMTRLRDEFADTTGAVAESIRHLSPTPKTRMKTEVLIERVRTADSKIRALQTCVKHFLDVPGVPNDEQLEVLEPRRMIEEAVAAVMGMDRPLYDVSFGNTKRVMAPTSAVKAALGHVLLFAPGDAKAYDHSTRYALHATVKGALLIIQLKGHFGPWSRDLHLLYPAGVSAGALSDEISPVSLMGLDHCQTVIEDHGGELTVDGDSGITMTFPVKGVAATARMRRALGN